MYAHVSIYTSNCGSNQLKKIELAIVLMPNPLIQDFLVLQI